MRFLQSLTSVLASICLLGAASVDAKSRSRNPLNYLTLIESPRIETPAGRVNAYSSFDLTFDLHRHSQHIRLSLEPNHDILHEDAHVEILDKDGNIKYAEKINRMDHKVYQGQAFLVDENGNSNHVGWARITVARDGVVPLFEGAFTILRDHHHISMKTNYMRTKHVQDPLIEEHEDEYMVMWRDSDISQDPVHTELRKREDGLLSCRSDLLEFNRDLSQPMYTRMLRRDEGYWGAMPISNILGKRQNIDGGGAGNGNSGLSNLRDNIGNTAGCPTTRKVALVGIATDCTYTADFNSTDSVRQNIINQVNTASDLYQSTFNITLGLRNLTVSDAECPGTASQQAPWNIGCNGGTITDRLNTFSSWRGSRGDSNAYWSLWTTCNTGAEVGLAWLGQLCNAGATSQGSGSNAQTVTGANVVARTPTEWQVFAHETGHTFGAVHDCDSSACQDSNFVNSGQCCPLSSSVCDANAKYLMNPFSASGITDFSPCSVGNICQAILRGSVTSSCLTDNRDVTVITGNQCGNGIVEAGEDCDCGGTEGCAGNACCNPQTCKFNTGAFCDPSNEGCCTSQCQFAGAGTVCRASTSSCDPQEVCPGNNGTCPPDSNSADGSDCGNGLKCASGQCTSRDLQCRTVMGSYTADNDTYACNSQTCQLSCASPDFGANTCYSMRQNFLDGTDCGGGGKCNNGVCSGSSVGGQISSFFNDNKNWLIPVIAVLGGLLVIAILGCIVRSCRRRRRRPARKPISPAMRQSRNGGWNGPPIPPQYNAGGYGSPPPPPQQQSWGYPAPSYPAPPAPTYNTNYGPRGSVRYA
jgi:hypothetical protein